jgi:molybdate transport system substrate-binding protein
MLFLALICASAEAGEVQVAVASNFIGPLKVIKDRFEKESGHTMVIIAGSTGKLFAQVKHGAPFDLLLAADALRPRLLEEEGFTVRGSRFTYAVGRLTLWSANPNQIQKEGAEIFQQQTFNHLAMANPKTAPYGRAALQALKKLGVWDQVRRKVVQGENIGQAFQFAATGNAELGFVALSQTRDPKNKIKGSRWDVPPDLYDPIYQDLVLLKRGRDNPAAQALVSFILRPAGRKIIADYGYFLK